MKNILMLLVLLTSEKTCGQQEQLPLLKATSQAWSGGAAGSGRGTNYEIFLGIHNSADYTFDSLWVQERRIKVEVNERKSTGDSLILAATDMTQSIRNMQDMNKAAEEVQPIPFPIAVTAEGVLGYHYKGKQQYLVIQNWIKLKPLFYP
ncbi:MAG: hypothetical protein IPO83_17235 [Chitinophagaceae bacterium]|nr:hypothetical protein [Chitinophagaceae bacterium]